MSLHLTHRISPPSRSVCGCNNGRVARRCKRPPVTCGGCERARPRKLVALQYAQVLCAQALASWPRYAVDWSGQARPPAAVQGRRPALQCVLHSQSLHTLLLLHTVFVPIVLQTLKRRRPASIMADGLRAWGNKACTDAPCVVATCSGLLASGRACGQRQSLIVTI